MKDERLVYAQKSGRPSLFRILIWMLAGEFFACILYGLGKGGSASFDAQMEGAPVFLTVTLTIDVLLGILFYHINGKRNTAIEIYEHTVRFSAPKVPVLDESGDGDDRPDGLSDPMKEAPKPAPDPAPAAKPDPAADPEEGNPFGEEPPIKRVNPYLRKKTAGDAPGLSEESLPRHRVKQRNARFTGSAARTGGRRIGKVTSDIPNSEVECTVSDLRSASRKGRNVLLIMENGDRYLFVRMSGAAQLVRVIEDKVAAEIRV